LSLVGFHADSIVANATKYEWRAFHAGFENLPKFNRPLRGSG
jgi:hypothetical protein